MGQRSLAMDDILVFFGLGVRAINMILNDCLSENDHNIILKSKWYNLSFDVTIAGFLYQV